MRLVYDWKLLKTKTAPLPVISIGNISLGGTGKTPLAIKILQVLENEGYKPALATRGYRGKWEKKGGILSDGKNLLSTWQNAGDEPVLIARNVPNAGVFVGKNRFDACQKANAMGFDVVVLDDGFQHLSLKRDLDIVLHDPNEKIALREFQSTLKHADIILLMSDTTDWDLEKWQMRFPQAQIFPYSSHSLGLVSAANGQEISPRDLQARRILAFCGIARPHRFFRLLEAIGIKLEQQLKFPDHHFYPQASIQKILHRCKRERIEVLITTEKDVIKTTALMTQTTIPVYFLKLDLDIEKAFFEGISIRLKQSTMDPKTCE